MGKSVLKFLWAECGQNIQKCMWGGKGKHQKYNSGMGKKQYIQTCFRHVSLSSLTFLYYFCADFSSFLYFYFYNETRLHT